MTAAAAASSVVAIAALVTPVAAVAAGGATAAGAHHAAKPVARAASSESKFSVDAAKLLDHRGPVNVMLQMSAPSGTAAYNAHKAQGATEARSAQIDAAAKADAAERAILPKVTASGATVIYRTTQVLSGIAVRADAAHLRALAALPGVARVLPLTVKHVDNAHAVTITHAPEAWAAGNTGAGTKIAVIDTGLDYTHSDFGGPGTVAAYDDAADPANNVALTGAAAAAPSPATCSLNLVDGSHSVGDVSADIDTSKVVDGCDFAGDDYDPSDPSTATPTPDSNPLDCPGDTAGDEGHGTHVAGTAAGYGTLASDGSNPTSYSTYDENAYKIGPGTAPQAELIGLRVFGCGGGTLLVSEALDWVAAYNVANPSSKIRVLNLSLGSDFNPGDDPDAIALGALTQQGILPVTSAGNSGDQYDVGGSPNGNPDVLAVAASDDGLDITDKVTVTGVTGLTEAPASYSAAYPYKTKPNFTGTVAAPLTGANADGCDPLSSSDAALVTGKIAIVSWDKNDTTRRCGSVGRSKNLTDAGAVGALFVNTDDIFDGSITGSALVPVALITHTAGMAIEDQTTTTPDSVQVTFSKDYLLSLKNSHPQTTDTPASFTSRAGTTSDGVLKPDVSAPGLTIFSADSGTGDEGHVLSGTSMASPHAAGIAVDVTAAHPSWSAGEIKAAIMNTATDDITTGGADPTTYSPTRVGGGRVRADLATSTDVVAFEGTDATHGPVSLGFGPVAVTTPTLALTKTVTVENKGANERDFTIAYNPVDAVSGVAVTTSKAGLTLAPGATDTFTVTATMTRALLQKDTDPTRDPLGGDLTTLAEATGRVDLSAVGSYPDLRIAFAIAPRPAAQMAAASSTLTIPAGQSQAPLALTGAGVSNFGDDLGSSYSSLVAGFQLGATSPELPDCAADATETDSCILFPSERAGDVHYTGAAMQDGLLQFAINTYHPWKTPAWAPFGTQGPGGDVIYSVYINSPLDSQGDHTSGYVTRAEHFPGLDADLLMAVTYAIEPTGDTTPDDIVDIEYLNAVQPVLDTDLLNSDSMILPVAPDAIGDPSTITYSVETDSFDDNGGPLDTVPSATFDLDHPGVTVGSSSVSDDQPNTYLNVVKDVTDTTQSNPNTVLLLHLHNTDGHRAELIDVSSTQTITFDPVATHKVGDPAFTVNPTASSGLPVTVTAGPSDVCAASGTDGHTITVLSAGTCTLTASQAGDDAFAAASPVTQSFTVTGAPGVTLTPFPGRHVTGQPIPVVVSIGTGGATGTVTIKTGSKVLGSGLVSGSVASVTVPGQHFGTYPLVASYSGDAANPAATSSPVTVVVFKGKTTTASSAKVSGRTVTLGISVKAVSPARGPVTGKVVITFGKKHVTKVLKRGAASVKVKPGTGVRTITITYKGSSDFTGSTVKKTVTTS
ncbi:MAG TPA: S8 family serine peptidase [Mycobacteriales bacterium]|nr:S8 family serine peptidase [Mycobacteriales bacterium]